MCLIVFLFGPGACFFCLLCGPGGVFFSSFFAAWAVACFCFCCLGGGRVFFCCLGVGRFFFVVWAGACSFFFCFCCLGGEREFTYRSAWLVFKQPNNKKDQTAKKRTRVPVSVYQAYLSLGSNATPHNIISMVFTHILAFKQAPP